MSDVLQYPRDPLGDLTRLVQREFAELLTAAVGLAAHSHPEELRTALSKVFELGAVEETANRLVLLVTRTEERVAELNRNLLDFENRLQKADKSLGRAEVALDRLRAAWKQLTPTNGAPTK